MSVGNVNSYVNHTLLLKFHRKKEDLLNAIVLMSQEELDLGGGRHSCRFFVTFFI